MRTANCCDSRHVQSSHGLHITLAFDCSDLAAQAAREDTSAGWQFNKVLSFTNHVLLLHISSVYQAKAPKRPRRVIPKDAESMAAAEAAKQKVAGQVSRDQHLSVFHAVGKILHYKRNQPEDAAAAARSDGAQEQQQQHATGNTAAAAAAGAAVAEDDGIDLCSVDVDAPQMPRLSSTRWEGLSFVYHHSSQCASLSVAKLHCRIASNCVKLQEAGRYHKSLAFASQSHSVRH